MAQAQAQDPKKVIVRDAILSYPKLFEPEPGPNGDEAKYGCTLVITRDEDLVALKKAAIFVAKEKFGDKAADLIKKKKLKMPFIKSTEDDAGYPEGSTYIRPRSKTQPGVVSIYPSKDDPKKPARITDPSELYPGAIVAASVVAFYYDASGNKGISFALNNVQKLRDGERIAGAVPAEDEFEVDASAVADLEDFEGDENEDEVEEETPKAKRGKGGAKGKRKPSLSELDGDLDPTEDAADGDDISDLLG